MYIKDKTETIHDSSVMLGMNAPEKLLIVTDDNGDFQKRLQILSVLNGLHSCGKHTLTIAMHFIPSPLEFDRLQDNINFYCMTLVLEVIKEIAVAK